MALVALAWLAVAPLSIARRHGTPVLGSVLTLTLLIVAAVAVCYRATGKPPAIGPTVTMLAQFVVVGMAGATLSYLATASSPFPLRDADLLALDRAMGFRWTDWTAWVHGIAPLRVSLEVAYGLLIPHFVVAAALLAMAGSADELMTAYAASIALTILGCFLIPGIGHDPHAHFAFQVAALRSGALHAIPMHDIEGLVTFPSFHTALPLIAIYAMRRSRLVVPFSAVGACIVLATPSEGAHYLIDLVGGAVVAVLACAYATGAAGLAIGWIPLPRRWEGRVGASELNDRGAGAGRKLAVPE